MSRAISGQFVGFSCREIVLSDNEPDTTITIGINYLGADCRECRVSTTEESAREITTTDIVNSDEKGAFQKPIRIVPVRNNSWRNNPINALTLLDLNDA